MDEAGGLVGWIMINEWRWANSAKSVLEEKQVQMIEFRWTAAVGTIGIETGKYEKLKLMFHYEGVNSIVG